MSNFLKLISLPSDIDAPTGNRLSPLASAISKSDEIGFDLILAGGANPNLTDSNGVTPLMASDQKNLLKTVQLLVLCDADVNKKKKNYARCTSQCTHPSC